MRILLRLLTRRELFMSGPENRDSVDYCDIAPGESSAIETIGIANAGTVDVDVSLEVEGVDATAQSFYE